PKMFGRQMSERLGKIHFWLSFIPINLIFCGMLIVGNAGMQRRLYNPGEYLIFKHLHPLNVWISRSAYVLFFGSVFFIYNFISAVLFGKKAETNPWKVGTLEWTHTTSPPVHHNFDAIPMVLHGPHEFNNPAVSDKQWREMAAPKLLPALNTLVLIGSSVLLALGLAAVRTARPRAFVRYLGGAIVLGVVFLALQSVVWAQMIGAGTRWDSGRYGSVFFTLT